MFPSFGLCSCRSVLTGVSLASSSDLVKADAANPLNALALPVRDGVNTLLLNCSFLHCVCSEGVFCYLQVVSFLMLLLFLV